MSEITPNRTVVTSGEEYSDRLSAESEKNFQILLLLLSSYWQSTIDGPVYARCLKAVSKEISRIRLSLDNHFLDNSNYSLRSDYLYQVLTSMVFPDGSPIMKDTDIGFQQFLISVLQNYFNGSTPKGILNAVELIYPSLVTLNERINPSNPTDTEFYFDVSVLLSDSRFMSLVQTDSNLRFLLDIVKPAHTLYTLRNVLNEPFFTSSMSDFASDNSVVYNQEEFRRDWYGIKGVDPLGMLTPTVVTNEDHS